MENHLQVPQDYHSLRFMSMRHHHLCIPPLTSLGLSISRTKESQMAVRFGYACCITRAIHLELVTDMTTTTFIRCLKRFSARRGLPRKILLNNAMTFKATAKQIQTIFHDKEVKNHLLHSGVEFNLERAPWWGGLFERMVKSIKWCLMKMVGQAKLLRENAYSYCRHWSNHQFSSPHIPVEIPQSKDFTSQKPQYRPVRRFLKR